MTTQKREIPLLDAKINSAAGFGAEFKPTQRVFDYTTIPVEQKIVQILPIVKKKHVDPRLAFRTYRDVENNINYGIPIEIDKDGTFKFRQIVVDVGRVFDLRIKSEAEEFFIARNHPSVQGSPFARGEKPKFYVYDEEEQARKFNERAKLSRKMFDVIDDMNDLELRDFARLFLGDTDDISTTMVRKRMNQIAQETPQRIQKHIQNPIMAAALKTVYRCISMGIIQRRGEEGWITNTGIRLGFTQEAAAAYLVANPDTQTALERHSQEDFLGYKKTTGIPGMHNLPTPTQDNPHELDDLPAHIADFAANEMHKKESKNFDEPIVPVIEPDQPDRSPDLMSRLGIDASAANVVEDPMSDAGNSKPPAPPKKSQSKG